MISAFVYVREVLDPWSNVFGTYILRIRRRNRAAGCSRIESTLGRYQTKRIRRHLNYSICLVGIYLAFFQNLLRIHSRKKQKNDFMVEHIYVHCVLSKILSEKVYNIPYILQFFCNGQNF